MDNNELNFNEENNTQPQVQPTEPTQPVAQTETVEPVVSTEPVAPVEQIESVVTDINNLEYSEVLKPGEEIDNYHHEQQVIDTKFLSSNILSYVGLILSFVVPVLPLILAIISLLQIKKTHQGGKPLAIAAIIINIIVIIVEIFISLYVFRIGPFENKLRYITDDQMRICKNAAYGCDTDEDGDGFKTCSYCKDGVECNDIVTIECPTDKLLDEENKNKENREKVGLEN